MRWKSDDEEWEQYRVVEGSSICLELFHLGKSHVAPIIHISDKNFLKMIDSVFSVDARNYLIQKLRKEKA